MKKQLLFALMILLYHHIVAQDFIVTQPLGTDGCEDGMAFFSLTLEDPASGFSYVWQYSSGGTNWININPAPAVLNANNIHTMTIQNITASSEGFYRVLVTKNAENDTSNAAFLNVLDPPAANAGADKELNCDALQVTLNGSNSSGEGILNYEWKLNGIVKGISSSLSTSETGTYTLTVSNICGSSTDQVIVTQAQNEFPTISISPTGPISLTCTLASVNLTATTNGIDPKWIKPSTSIVNGLLVVADVPGLYKFTSTLSNCKDTVVVNVGEDKLPPVFSITPPNPGLCKGGSEIITLKANVEGTASDYSYAWSGTPVVAAQEKTVQESGSYTVTVTKNSNGCTASKTAVVEEYETPLLSNIITPITFRMNSSSITFGPDIEPDDAQLNWRLIDYQNVKMQQSPTTGTGKITRTFLLDGESRTIGTALYSFEPNNQGCIGDSVIIEVDVLPDLASTDAPFIPEIYTPNGDGQNDVWQVAMPDGVEKGEYTIFNRLGGKVYAGDTLNPWDGSACPDGPYFYVLRYTQDGAEKVVKGAVTILRTTD